MVRRNIGPIEAPNLEQDMTKLTGKSLPQILDDIERSIQAIAVAIRKAEEAAGGAADRAEKASNKVMKVSAEILKRIESLEKTFNTIEDSVSKETVVVLREISKEDAKAEILKLFKQGKVLYYSDIARELQLDLELVVDVCEELQKQGEIAKDAGVS